MKIQRYLIVLAILLMLLPSSMVSASQSAMHLFIEQVDITGFPEVSVQMSVWDESGLPVADLEPKNITVLEGDGVPFHPATVEADNQASLQVMLVMDVSGSMEGTPIVDARSAAARFLDRLSSDDRAGLLAFSDGLDPDPAMLNPDREIALSRDFGPVYDTIEKLQAQGGTQLYQAVAKSVRMAQNAEEGHRAILLLSDGQNDPPNQGNPEEAILLAREARIPVFVIGLGDKIDEPYLRRLASETGGLFRVAPRSSELARLFDDMAVLLKTRYTVTYTSRLAAEGQVEELNILVQTNEGSVTGAVEFGPLPAAPAATSTSVPTTTPVPPTQTPEPPATAVLAVDTPTPEPPASLIQDRAPWEWLAGGGAALLVLAMGIIATRKPKPPAESCAKCGFDLTGKSGPCPQCGETRRLARAKKR